jgi:proteasome lid subunit RPN8/RPN11
VRARTNEEKADVENPFVRIGRWLLVKLSAPERYDEVRLEPEVVEDICALARSADPKETIAFLTGSIQKEKRSGSRTAVRILVIDGLYLKGYQADTYSTHFTMHDLPMTGVYGTVHSHPSSSNRPSGADLRMFNKHGTLHLIICRPYSKEALAAYDKYGERILL